MTNQLVPKPTFRVPRAAGHFRITRRHSLGPKGNEAPIPKGFALMIALIQAQGLDVACQARGHPMPTKFVPAMLRSSSSLVMVVTAQWGMCSASSMSSRYP